MADWSSSAAASAAAVAAPAPAPAEEPWMLRMACNVLNSIRTSLPTSTAQSVHGAIDVQGHLQDWGNAYINILTIFSTTGPLIKESIQLITKPIFTEISTRWKELIPIFLQQAEPAIGDINQDYTTDEGFDTVVRGILNILRSCSVFSIPFPPHCTLPTGQVVPLADVSLLTVWQKGERGATADPRIPCPLNSDQRAHILLSIKTMLRSAAVISTSTTQLTETIVAAADRYFKGQELEPRDLMRLFGEAQTNLNLANIGSIIKVAPVLFASIKGEADMKAKMKEALTTQ
jgi:hypothetical protein